MASLFLGEFDDLALEELITFIRLFPGETEHRKRPPELFSRRRCDLGGR